MAFAGVRVAAAEFVFEACGVFVGRRIPAHRRSFSVDAGPPLARVGDVPSDSSSC